MAYILYYIILKFSSIKVEFRSKILKLIRRFNKILHLNIVQL